MSRVGYEHWLNGFQRYRSRLLELLDTAGPHAVCEIGGGANPTLSLDEVRARHITYTVLDISQAELDKAPAGYTKLRMDITKPTKDDTLRFDFMFSRLLAEHIQDPAQFHRNVLGMLNPGGTVAHFMPTLYDPSFVANRLLPEVMSRRIVKAAQPNRRFDSNEGKFPAYYRWCRGPSRRQLDRFESLGFEVVEATGYFGTGYLGDSIPGRVYDAIARLMLKHPLDALCSYLWIVLRKPHEPGLQTSAAHDRRHGTP